MLNLGSMIPGYAAYRRQESRREDDRLTREFVVKRIDECKTRLDALGARAASNGDLELPLAIEQLRSELDRARARVTSAVEGYSGWFSQRIVDEKVLEQVALQDENLVSVVDMAYQQIAESPLPIDQLTESVQLLHQRIDRRAALLTQS